MKKIDIIDNMKAFVDELFDEGISLWASDIHIEPKKDSIVVRYRVDGELHLSYDISNTNKDNLLTRIKIMGQLKIDENRKPQDGQIVYTKDGEDVDLRVSTFPTIYGEKIVVRILRKDQALLNINSLGFLQINLNLIKQSLNLKEGLILVSWPTGSWKTTTLYSLLNSFDPAKFNISTLEDPVEYKIEWINQSQVKPEIGYTFTEWLKTLLRQDPDVILVWEIRDRETAKLAIEASLTWHIVLWTIHANRWLWVAERLINMWIEPYLVASSLKLIISQRLAKKIHKCAKTKSIDANDEKILSDGLSDIWWSIKSSAALKEPIGCPDCLNSWYRGRIWLHEVIRLDNDFSKIILWGLDKQAWEKLMHDKGFLTLYQDWLLKAASWLTDLKQILPFKLI